MSSILFIRETFQGTENEMFRHFVTPSVNQLNSVQAVMKIHIKAVTVGPKHHYSTVIHRISQYPTNYNFTSQRLLHGSYGYGGWEAERIANYILLIRQ